MGADRSVLFLRVPPELIARLDKITQARKSASRNALAQHLLEEAVTIAEVYGPDYEISSPPKRETR